MKCTNCGYISFDDLPQCRRCGAMMHQDAINSDKTSAQQQSARREPAGDQESTPQFPPQWNATIQRIKRELEEIEGKPVDRKSHIMGRFTNSAELLDEEPASAPLIAPIQAIRKGGFLLRMLAYLIDGTLINLLSILLLTLSYIVLRLLSVDMSQHDSYIIARLFLISYFFVSTLIELFYLTYCHAVTGQTIGKWICGLKVVTTEGALLGFGRALLRWIGYYISRLPMGLGFIWIAVSRQKQGWHDKIAGSYVIRV